MKVNVYPNDLWEFDALSIIPNSCQLGFGKNVDTGFENISIISTHYTLYDLMNVDSECHNPQFDFFFSQTF